MLPAFRVDEVKVLWPPPWGGDPEDVIGSWLRPDTPLMLQPTADQDGSLDPEVLRKATRWLVGHSGWRLSVQLHKLFNWR